MADWQERIDRTTPPSIRLEHEVRYQLAAPLVAAGEVWCDLGCGTGLAAASALARQERRPARAVLVDFDEAATRAAAAELGVPETATIVADLTSPDDLARVRAALLEGPAGPRTITCFEVVEHLQDFVPLLELLVELAGADVTTVLSVPNDAFWAVENPHHQATWGEGSFAELRGLLPEDHVVLGQIELRGSAVAPSGGSDVHTPTVAVEDGGVPTHFLAALGPQAAALRGLAAVAQTDLGAQRTWERQREADAAIVPALLAELAELRAKVSEDSAEFDSWRRYIHELEGKLGIPPSGSPERRAYDAARS